ncbi:MAG: response regulator [Butyricicoccus sp.]|nr:response regulator [Butyricicoccus sp.]
MRNEERDILLVVDDYAVNRAILEQIFADRYTVMAAEDGETGLAKILEAPERLCAVLLDVVMPGIDGLEVLRRLNRKGLLDTFPIFLITAEASSQVLQESYSLGVMDVISKPVLPYVVRRRVQSVIELYQTRQRLGRTVESQKEKLLRQAEEIIELNQGMVEALAAAIEFRSEESGAHVHRIHDATKCLLSKTAWGKGLSEQDIQEIALASILHDVGKIAVPDAILNKPGRLTAEEFETMKTHTVQGAALLAQIPQLRRHHAYHYAVDIARHHHERWDGRGYPDGLKGEEISIWAQAVSLADVYDALSCKRVYKSAFPRERVLEMIRNGECGVFNPELLRCFFEVEEELSHMYEKKGTE